MVKVTTYIVSGYMRSGTSVMMKALVAGGLEAVWDTKRDQKMIDPNSDEQYRVNESLYELADADYARPGFPNQYQGKLIKVLWGWALLMSPGDYRVVFMLREPEEIRQSYRGAFGGRPHPLWGSDFYRWAMASTIRALHRRHDVQITLIWLRRLIDDPLGQFQRLREQGWPIEVFAAAETIDPELYRYRAEELEVGI